MSELLLIKAASGALVPADDDTREILQAWKLGQGVRVTAKKARNLRFHRKFFALLGVAFDAWVETLPACHIVHDRVVLPNRDRFRKDVTVMAGFFEAVWNARGEVRLEPKSISFGNMEEPEFEALYQQVINVLIQKVLPAGRWDEASLRDAVESVLEFA